jgi:hypothetical protein
MPGHLFFVVIPQGEGESRFADVMELNNVKGAELVLYNLRFKLKAIEHHLKEVRLN